MDQPSRNMLIISYAFPPIPYAGTYRALRLCKQLNKIGVNVHILTVKISKDIPNDFELLEQVPKTVNVHRTMTIDPLRKYRSIRKKFGNNTLISYINKVITLLLRYLTIPDHMVFWIPFGLCKAKKIIQHHNIDTIMVSSPPVSALLMGCILKITYKKVKYIVDLRDPIVDNVFEVHLINPKDFLSKFEKYVRVKIEKLVIKLSDLIITTSETYKNYILKSYNINNVYSILNSYDEDDYEGIIKNKYNKFTISHIGSIVGLRRVDLLFEAIKIFIIEMGPDCLDFQVLFIGVNDPNLKRMVTEFSLERYVDIKGLISHKKAIQVMASSHLLLLVKELSGGGYAQIPAKFFEYMGSRNKILFIGPVKHETAKIIKKLELGYVIEDNITEMLDILKKEYLEYRRNNRSRTGTNLDISIYNSDHMAKKVYSLIYN